ncbi:MAG: P1 family peptidase [Pseudobutyrivibrio sp.]|nr:P1 family peptidase [Pseudobutyrivibrio sp.]
MKEIDIMEVGGFRIGHEQNAAAKTGCTVMLFDEPSQAGVDVRGGGPASRETPLLNPLTAPNGINAILLSGGSAFGLDAAGGVMEYLEERGIGFDVGITKVPLVCQSDIFDLNVCNLKARPDKAMAYHACEKATKESPAQGSVGVGLGATVGKYAGIANCMKGGIGHYALELGKLKVGAIVVVNALGDVYDMDSGNKLAGAKDPVGNMLFGELPFFEAMATLQGLHEEESHLPESLFTANTTLGIVVTNAKLTKTELNKVAGMAHNGYGRAIRPVHTTADGDSIYAVSSKPEVEATVDVVGPLAAYVMGKAINNAVINA